MLTSFDHQDVHDLGYPGSVTELVEWRVRKSHGMRRGRADRLSAGSRRGAPHGRAGKIIVTPGVRSAGAAKGDQKRVATPAEAIRDGANYVVMGRQITRAADPAAEVARVLDEIHGAARPAPSR